MKLFDYAQRAFVKKILNDIWTIVDYGHYHPIRGLRKQAYEETMAYIATRLPDALCCSTEKDVMIEALRHMSITGHVLEFGVYTGGSINFIAGRLSQDIHGFDSFEGLPSEWSGMDKPKGTFSLGKKTPRVRDNVKLHVGWFDKTLPVWASSHSGPVSLMHIDCDIYPSTKCIFDSLGDRIVPGTVIVFDEYFNMPGWKSHEYKAFQEYIQQSGKRYEYLCFSQKEVAVKII